MSKILPIFLIFVLLAVDANCLNCYQCDTNRNISCDKSSTHSCSLTTKIKIKINLTRCVKLVMRRKNGRVDTAKNCTFYVPDFAYRCQMFAYKAFGMKQKQINRRNITCYVCKRNLCNSTGSIMPAIPIVVGWITYMAYCTIRK